MAVNYLGYAQAGNRNPFAEGLSSLGDTLDKNAMMKRQANIDARQSSLADLQMQREKMALDEAQREQVYKQGLREAMSNPQTTTQFTPRPTVVPALQTAPTALQPQPEFSMPQPETTPAVQAYNEGRVKSSTESPAAAGAKFAMSQGRPEEAAKMISVDDALAQYAAKVQAGGGDPRQYYAAKADLDQAKEVASIIHANKDQPEVLKAMWPSIVRLVPKAATMDPFNVKAGQEGILIPFKTQQGETVKGKYYYYDNKKQMHVYEEKPEANATIEQLTSRALKGDTHAQAVLDAMQKRELEKARAGKAITGGNGGQTRTPQGKPPIGYRFTPDGNLEPIPGGPAEQKMTAAVKSQEGALQAIDTALNSVKTLIDHPGRKSATGFSSVTNPAAIPGGDAATFLAELDTFKSQMFVPMVQQLKGMGQLSDAEGKKLTAAVGALEPGMSEAKFKASLQNIMRELEMTKRRTAKPISSSAPSANRPDPLGLR